MTLDVSETMNLGFHCSVVNGQLPPEPPYGNIEYKLKLVPANETRLQHLTSQLKWRLREGLGEAIYEIGVGDDGKLVGLNEEDMQTSLTTLEVMAKCLGAEILLARRFDYGGKKIAEVMLRQTRDDPDEFVDFRIAVMGNVDSGKSTIVGVLSSGELDNGRGKARLNLFRHPHEIQTGRTSCVSREMIGFTTTGQVINYSMSDTPEQILQQSFKLITFTDLAGHQKYFRTTISGLMASQPNFVMLVVSGQNSSSSQGIAEHLVLATALRLPVFIVVTKVDRCDAAQVTQVVADLTTTIDNSTVGLCPVVISTEDDCIGAAFRLTSETVVPIFTVSNVTGQNLNLLTKFLSMLPCTVAAKARDLSSGEPAEFHIGKVFEMDGVGTVVAGILMRGVISSGDLMVLGPDRKGEFTKVKIKSIQRNHSPCKLIRAGQSAAIAITVDDARFSFRRGMILADMAMSLTPCLEFEGIVRSLTHSRMLSRGLEGTMHCGYIRQATKVTEISTLVSVNEGGNSQSSVVRLKFMKQPECLRVGDQFIFRDGKLKAIGTIERIVPVAAWQKV